MISNSNIEHSFAAATIEDASNWIEQKDTSILSTIAQKALTPYEIVTDNPSFKDKIVLPSFEKAVLENKIGELIKALEERDWLAHIFEDDDSFAYYALEALKAEKLTLEQFGTILIYYSLKELCKKGKFNTEDILNIPVFSDKGVDPIAKELLFKSLCSSSKPKYNLSIEQFDQFIERLKQKPLSEQQIFLIPELEPFLNFLSNGDSISQRVRKVGLNILSYLNTSYTDPLTNADYMIVAPLGMQQLYIDTRFKHSVKMHPVIGLSTIESIKKNGLTKTRDFGLPFPGLTLPTEADTLPCPHSINFWYHDFYHTAICSQIPDEHCKGIIRLAEKVKEVEIELQENAKDPQNSNKYNEEIQAYLNRLYEKLIDLEFVDYNSDDAEQLSFTFWKNVNHDFNSSMNVTQETGMENASLKEQLLNNQIFERIIEKIFKEKEIFSKEHKIKFEVIPLVRDKILSAYNHLGYLELKQRHMIFALCERYEQTSTSMNS